MNPTRVAKPLLALLFSLLLFAPPPARAAVETSPDDPLAAVFAAGTTPVPLPGFVTLDDEIAAIRWESNDTMESLGDPRAVKGGTFRWPIQAFPTTVRAVGPNANTAFNSMMEGMCYEPLIGIHPVTLDWMPGLAHRWATGAHRRVFYFRMDPDARFADGTPVAADDVVASWEFFTHESIKDPFYNSYYATVEPQALAPDIVRFISKDDGWRAFMKCAFIQIFAAKELRPCIAAGDYVDRYQFKFMLGTGPYEFDSQVKGREIVLRRRPGYWAEKKPTNVGLSNFDKVRFIVVHDESLMFEMFKKGDLDFYYVNVARQWKQECDFDKIRKGWIQKRKVYTDKPCGITGLAFNMREKPFDDARVRRALAFMFPREVMINKLFFDEYIPLDSYYPGGIYENPDNERIRYDPDVAVKLLAEAGYDRWDGGGRLVDRDGRPFEFSLMYSDKSMERILTVIQEYMADIGITVKLKLVTSETQFALINERKFKVDYRSWTGLLFPNPRSSFHSSMADKAGTTNICGVADPAIDALIDEYDACQKIERRIEIIREMDGLLMKMHSYALSWYAPFDRVLYWNRYGHPDFYFSKTGNYQGMLGYWWIDPEKDRALEAAIASGADLPVGETEVTYWPEYNERMRKRGEGR